MAPSRETPASASQPTTRHHADGVNGYTNGVNSNGVNGNDGAKTTPPAPIAVVGMACRFAGNVTSPAKLWDLCTEGRDCWSPIPKERFDVKSLYHPDRERPGRSHATGGYFMNEDVALFDAAFFNFPADVANERADAAICTQTMDPQIRLLLEVVYESTEDAGIPMETLSGTNTSVFSGCYGKDYHDLQTRDPEAMQPSFLIGNYTAMMSNRISHYYNLQGASMSIDTGCSAGLACLHQGCLTIRTGESDVSIVGASSTMLNPDIFIAMSTLGMVGKDGRCYAWDERAQGYGRGEGVAALVLKSLDAALRDGDRIHAVIRETGLNQDGKTQSITSPSVDAQVRLIRDCYRRAGLDLSETGYVEAHMTGTQVGDLAEAKALAQTFGTSRRTAADASEAVLVGSVKTNIGHTEGVSGLAAIIKAVYAMKSRQVPANQNYAVGNPEIKLNDWHLNVPAGLTAWPKDKPLRTSINNFGYGGTNAHVILEAAPLEDANMNGNGNGHASIYGAGSEDDDSSRVFVVSAKDTNVARTMAKNLAAHLRLCIEDGEEHSLGDLAYTLAERRSRLDCVAAARATTLAELVDRLESPALKVSPAAVKKPRLGFVFNGQGAQWHAMGRELINTYPVFASTLAEADDVLRSYGADWSLEDGTAAELMRDAKSTRVSEIHLSQPVTVALQICLVQLLRSWDIHPSAVVSHSSGEIAAAFTVGALSFREALGVVYYRGDLARKHKNSSPQEGGMAAAGISASDAERYTANTTAGGRVVVACVNSPESVTLSGDLDDLDEVVERLERDGLFARKLKVPLAYHSHHMLPVASDYTDKLKHILPPKCSWEGGIVYATPVTGNLLDSPDGLTPEHWVRNLTSPVLFSEAFEAMSGSVDAVVEVGPHGTLAGPIRQILNGRKMPHVSCLKRHTNAVDTMQDLACDLLGLGYPVSLGAVNAVPGSGCTNFVPNLPTYAWNHTRRYWVESRVNRDIRQKRFPPHELLGLPVAGGTPLTAEWRNFLRLSDVPWLIDHQVDSQVVLPGAAYISMAVEAAHFLADESDVSTEGYRIRDAEFLNALTVPESSAVEVRLHLQPVESSGWYDFRVGSMGGSGTWVDNCRGQVSIVAEQDTSKAPCRDQFFDVGGEVRDVDASDLVAKIGEMSIKYGPLFQNLKQGRAAANKAVMDLRISSVASGSQSYIIHPTTLDCIVQATYEALPDGTSKRFIVLPRSAQSMFIPRHVHQRAGEKLHVFTELQQSHRKGFTSAVVVANAGDTALSPLRIENLFCQAISRGNNSTTSDPELEVSQYQSLWKLDVLHGIPKTMKDSMRITLADDDTAYEKKMLRASYYLISNAVSQLENETKHDWTEYRKMMSNWMLEMVNVGKKGELGSGSKMWSRATKGMKQGLFDELSRGDASGQLLVRVGAKMAEILRGHITPLELMVEGDLLNKYYMELPMLKSRSYKHVAHLTRLFAVKNPGAEVLEIGGGSGGATQVILDAFGAGGGSAGSLLGRYTFTDASPNSLELARQNLASWGGLVDFQELDIEKDAPGEADAVITGSFDFIVASMAFSKTKSIEQALQNIRKLLKPSGKLLLVEPTRNKLDIQLISRTLPGWWSSEEQGRRMSPHVRTEAWDEALRSTGFTGVDFEIGDCEQTQFQCSSTILSTAAAPLSLPSAVSVVYTAPVPEAWNAQLSDAIQKKAGISVRAESLDQVEPEDKVYIFTGDMTGPFVNGMDQASFHRLQQLIVRSRGVLWLSCGGAVDAQSPIHAQSQGLLRTLRQENASTRYIHLDFEQTKEELWTLDKIDHIVCVLQQSMDDNIGLDSVDWEYAVKDNVLHIPRVFPDDGEIAAPKPHEQPFHQPGRTVVWQSEKSIFAESGQIKVSVSRGMVQIEVRAFGLRPRHTATDDEDIAVYDLAGVVSQCGADTEESGLRAGDRVSGLAKGPFASTAQAHWTAVVKVPDNMSFVDAASIPIAYAAAYHSLIDIGRLRRGESVLIHPATDDVSQAAIIVAQHTGADVFATFDSDSERAILLDKYNLPTDRVISSHDMSISATLKVQTRGKGVDVVLGSSSSLSLDAVQNCIARFGRIVQTGAASAHTGQTWNVTFLGQSTTYACVDVMEVAEYNGHVFRDAMEKGVQICHSTRQGLPPVWPVAQYPVSQMEEAVRQRMQKGHATKVVVLVEPEDLVNVITPPQLVSLAEPNATYLVVGGSGGLGRVIVSWMMDNGARNILIVSRNADKHADALALLERAKREGRNLQIQNCDIASEKGLIVLLERVRGSMPPIRGVVDAAMVLEDSVFERMTYDQWKRTVLPKVVGTTNLDKHLPPDMAFFILLSSVTGVAGHLSQANYSAGNTFQDAFARHRVARGKPAISIDLSAVTDAGVVTDDAAAKKRIEALGSKSIPVQAVLNVLEKAIQRRPVAPEAAQVIVNLKPWSELAPDATVRLDRRFGTLRLGLRRADGALAAGALESQNLSPSVMLAQALSQAQANGKDAAGEMGEAVARALATRLSTIFNINADEIDLGLPLTTYGVDSLVAVELRNWLAAAGGVKISIFEILQAASLHEIAALVMSRREAR
ncbi:Uu.00g024550.m01.CDS01 [Anthostomella pinea]|uniref:Uu.00g024550.m01.CDS01 n=1 Tax=Anthostomella pinea TaxID=933095 RepID=A0AAI8VUD8_9PEZI|nr:Uu.00g024550.m01.CDS01 [Anthostomella pinea]